MKKTYKEKHFTESTMKAGIESLSFYVPRYCMDLKTLADHKNIDFNKYYTGLGQHRMSIIPPDEDIVTMGAHAAHEAMKGINPATIDTVMFATESGIDQSKSAAVYVHGLLGLPPNCKSFELKQACCSGTAGLLVALAMVQVQPHKKILLIAADVARYGFDTAGEPTQGAGAVAMVISATPKLMALGPENGSYTSDVMDFWRPNYMEEALVDGKYSIKVYLKALDECWNQYVRETGRDFNHFKHFCYHMPFTKMAQKAHMHLAKYAGDHHFSKDELHQQIMPSLRYNRLTGNLYTASLYVGLASLLEDEPDVTGERIGMFSYGSGCVGMFFGGEVPEGYRQHIKRDIHEKLLSSQQELTYEEYRQMYAHQMPTDGSNYQTPIHQTGHYRLCGINEHKRIYAPTRSPDTKIQKNSISKIHPYTKQRSEINMANIA